jgi:starch-binding outer membrane protein, SusD/RagB family
MTKYILLFAALALATQSCNDDFLERYPETSIAKENFFKSEGDLETYIYSLYDFPGFSIYVGDNSTDNAATTGATEIKNMMIGTPSPATVVDGWGVTDWAQLRSINYFLQNSEGAPVNEEALMHYQGIARFFRAKFYMEKVKRYSDVPWFDKAIETGDPELYKGRDSRADVVARIFEDYAFAVEHVREDSRSGAVNKWVVLAYEARHALHEGTFRKYHPELSLQNTAESFLQLARDAAQQIINDGGFEIYNTGSPMLDYGSLFNSTDLAGNSEVILATFSQTELLNSGWWGYMFGNYEVNPARDLLQAYLMDDGSAYTDQADFETNLFVEEFADRDPRLYQTYAYPGWELINTSTYAQGAGIYVQQLTKNFSGYHQIKGFVNDKSQAVQNSIDVPVIRFAEILLIYAEAKAELGGLSQADLDLTINALRDRAGMPHLSLTPQPDAVLQQQYPNVSGAQANVLLEIRRERRIELALEGFRFDDLMRWSAGKLIEKEPEGLFFPGLGKYDLTGDGIDDILLINNATAIPADADKEENSLGKKLIYYRVGPQNSDASFYLSNGTSGTSVTDPERGVFVEPKYYYRPVPQSQVLLNPNLKQVLGW